MKRTFTLIILAVAVLGLSSCRLVKKNLDVMKDTVSTAQPDDVVVERGGEGAVRTGETAAPEGHEHAVAPSPGGYTVQKGDTLSGIARRYGVALSELRAANHMTGTDENIRSGQILVIPGGARHAATSAAPTRNTGRGGGSYTVKPGETLSSIAARHHTSVSAILKANGLKPEQADRIRNGQVLKMPTGKK